MRFRDRSDAGRQLAERLGPLTGEDVVVLGLPRGGVPVALEVARHLGAPLDVMGVRKLGAPRQPEFGFGAVAEDGARVVDEGTVAMLGLRGEEIAEVAAREEAELRRRVRRYRGDRPLPSLAGKTVIVVDDGLATGVTAAAALRAVRARQPRRLVMAAPVGAAPTVAALREEADEVVTVHAPDDFTAVGRWYEHFDQTSDETVEAALTEAGSLPR